MASSPLARRGISLLEVLMTIFIIAIGLASVFALFMAGREIDARTTRQTEAAAVAQAVGMPLADAWCNVSQWQFVDPVANRLRWANDGTSIAIPFPVVVDPWGLSRDELGNDAEDNPPVIDPVITGARDTNWGFDRFVPTVGSGLPFARVTLPAIARTGTPAENPPLSREQAISGFAGPDAIEFKTSTDDALPPLPVFEFGRRKRGTDFIPALFISHETETVQPISAGTATVRRWLLVFHKPAAAYLEGDGLENQGSVWPLGCHQFFDDHDPASRRSSLDLLELREDRFGSRDSTDIARSLQPGKWILVTLEDPDPLAPSVVAACWRKVISATRNEDTSWLLALEEPLPSDWWGPTGIGGQYFIRPGTPTAAKVRAYGFESLIHVQRMPGTSQLTGL